MGLGSSQAVVRPRWGSITRPLGLAPWFLEEQPQLSYAASLVADGRLRVQGGKETGCLCAGADVGVRAGGVFPTNNAL